MPIYEYKCGSCGQIFEIKQRFADAPLTTHEGCGGAVQRLISAPALQFKGSGFYITDYAKGGGAAQKPKSGGDANAAPTTKSDKPASGDSSTSSSSSSSSTSSSTDSKK